MQTCCGIGQRQEAGIWPQWQGIHGKTLRIEIPVSRESIGNGLAGGSDPIGGVGEPPFRILLTLVGLRPQPRPTAPAQSAETKTEPFPDGGWLVADGIHQIAGGMQLADHRHLRKSSSDPSAFGTNLGAFNQVEGSVGMAISKGRQNLVPEGGTIIGGNAMHTNPQGSSGFLSLQTGRKHLNGNTGNSQHACRFQRIGADPTDDR